MLLQKPSFIRLAFLLLVVVPLAAWMLVKPVRVVAPGLVGITCISEMVCTDDLSKGQEAAALYAQAQGFVSAKVSPLRSPPKVIFCATDACAESFGLGALG